MKVHDADASDAGTYSCLAGKNGKTDSADFQVEVEIPVVPRVEVSPSKSIVNCNEGKKGCKIDFKVTTTDGSVSISFNHTPSIFNLEDYTISFSLDDCLFRL